MPYLAEKEEFLRGRNPRPQLREMQHTTLEQTNKYRYNADKTMRFLTDEMFRTQNT